MAMNPGLMVGVVLILGGIVMVLSGLRWRCCSWVLMGMVVMLVLLLMFHVSPHL